MINPFQIQRMLRSGAYRRVVGRILMNGRSTSDLVLRRLQEPDACEEAALGLALQRLCELTYGPSALAAAIASRLADRWRAAGARATDCTRCLPSAAVALRGLIEWRRVCCESSGVSGCVPGRGSSGESGPESGGDTGRDSGRDPGQTRAEAGGKALDRAIERGVRAVSEHLRRAELQARDPVGVQVARWQLGPLEPFRRALGEPAGAMAFTPTRTGPERASAA